MRQAIGGLTIEDAPDEGSPTLRGRLCAEHAAALQRTVFEALRHIRYQTDGGPGRTRRRSAQHEDSVNPAAMAAGYFEVAAQEEPLSIDQPSAPSWTPEELTRSTLPFVGRD